MEKTGISTDFSCDAPEKEYNIFCISIVFIVPPGAGMAPAG
jgi:hypothetical protein